MKRRTGWWLVCLVLTSAAAASAAPMYHLTTLATFNGANGVNPHGDLIADASGNLYGTTQATVFKLAAGTHALTTLATFNGANGVGPDAGLLADAAGNLYGTTVNGGDLTLNGGLGYGVVFEVAAGTYALSTLATFNGVNGQWPYAGLIADASGNLYGTTFRGGANDAGTVFEVAAGANTLSTLVSFNGTNGAYPLAGLIADASGNLYGTTSIGGARNVGTVFEVAAGTRTLSTLATFNVANGATPSAGLIADANGNLLGTTRFGGATGLGTGTVFEVANDASHTFTSLATFDFTDRARPGPRAGLIADASGNLYGTTFAGGPQRAGTVFELDAGTHGLSTLATFNGPNGDGPTAGLIADANGNLYGTTSRGGAYDRGIVFELSPVPEPSTFILAAVGILSSVTHRQRRH